MPDRPSATPQARKLGLRPGQRVALDEAPRGWRITDPPDDLASVGDSGPADVIDDDWSGLRLVWRVANRAGSTSEGTGP